MIDERNDDPDLPELSILFGQYSTGRTTRRGVLAGVGRLTGAAAAAMLVEIFEHKQAVAATGGNQTDGPNLVRMSLREMSDRLEVQQNLWDYCNAVDLQNWDALDQVFTPDVQDIYGPNTKTLADAKAFLESSLPTNFSGYYHMMQNMRIEVAGDTAESHTRCLNPMMRQPENGQLQADFHLIWYHWAHIRTSAGWRISGRLRSSDDPRGIHWSTGRFPSDQLGPPLERQPR